MLHLTYTLYPKTNRLCDTANVCSIHDKFFSDSLVELSHIADDNYMHIPEVTYRFGSVDKHNPRMEIQIQAIMIN